MYTSSYPMKKVSILILGKTQSGKSLFIEYIKKYADPNYKIDLIDVGYGNFSKTATTRAVNVGSNLPAYEVVQGNRGAIPNLVQMDELFDEDETFRRLLNARDKDFTLRQKSYDPHSPPSETVEFSILDTPGLNNTTDRDQELARDIIRKIIEVRSFNLILIVVNSQNAVSMEQQRALEYFSDVFQGLRANVAFLYTHIDYTKCHPSNGIQERDLKTKNQFLHFIFRRPDNEDGTKSHDQEAAMNEDCEEYPSFAIDLDDKRPVMRCLIRNTIREILQLAVMNPPVVLDQDIDRILRIPHPNESNDERRKVIQESFAHEYGPEETYSAPRNQAVEE